MKYTIWRACERLGIKPPGMVEESWSDLDIWTQANLIAYENIREYEEMETINQQLELLAKSR